MQKLERKTKGWKIRGGRGRGRGSRRTYADSSMREEKASKGRRGRDKGADRTGEKIDHGPIETKHHSRELDISLIRKREKGEILL